MKCDNFNIKQQFEIALVAELTAIGNQQVIVSILERNQMLSEF